MELRVGLILLPNEQEIEKVFEDTITDINKQEFSIISLKPLVKRLHNYSDTHMVEILTCELIEQNVVAIFGPTSKIANGVVASICSHIGIPHFMFTWKDEENYEEIRERSMSINVFPYCLELSKAYQDIFANTGWKRFIVIYETDEGLVKLQDVLGLTNPGDDPITVRKLSDEDDHGQLVKSIRKGGEAHIVLDCSPEKSDAILKYVDKLNMSNEYYDYFLTDLDSHVIDFDKFKQFKFNVTYARIGISHHEFFRYLYNKSKLPMEKITTSALLLHDALKLFASSLRKYGPPHNEHLQLPRGNCRSNYYWSHGQNILTTVKEISSEETGFMSGPMIFNKFGQRIHFQVDIFGAIDGELHKRISWREHIIYSQTKHDIEKKITEQIQNKTFRVSTRIGEPYIIKKNGSDPSGPNSGYEGYAVELIEKLAEKLKFQYKIKPVDDNRYGSYNKDTKKWDGIIGELVTGNADLGICDLTITYERRTAVDFTVPFMSLGISILYTIPIKKPPNLFSFLSPFGLEVWIYMATAYLVISILLFALARVSKDEWENPHPCNPEPEEVENIWTIPNTTWLTMGSIMGQGCDILPKSISMRLVTSMWWFFALMMLNSYTANLAAYLTSSRMEEQFRNIDDLAAQNKIKYGAVQDGSTSLFFKTSNETTYRRIWAGMENASPSVFTKNNNEGRSRVLTGKRLYAFLMESTMIEYMTERDCELTGVGDSFGEKFYGIALPLNSPYRKAISEQILKMSELGEMYQLKTKWWKEMYVGNSCLTDATSNDNELTVDQVGGVFLVLGSGILVAFIIGVCEFFWNVQRVAVEEKVTPYEALKTELIFASKFWIRHKPVNTSSSESMQSRRSSKSKLVSSSEVHSINTEVVQASSSNSLRNVRREKINNDTEM